VRVGIFDPYLDDLGGGEKYMMTIAECLSKKHEVSVFWDNKKDIDDLLQRFSLDFSKVSISRNIFSRDFGFFRKIFKSRKYDVIIVLSDGSIPFLLSKKTFLHVQQPLNHIEKKKLKTGIKLLRITGIFCNSEYTKSFNVGKFSIMTTVIYPPVNQYSNKIKKENIILHVGRFRVKNVSGVDDYKKQGVMIEAFKEMVDEGFKDWEFVMAVSVRDEELLKFEEMKKSAKGYPVRFIVNSSNDVLGQVYSKAKIYWHASGFGENLDLYPEYAEHFGISTVEAMSAGCVPVVINAGGQREIVEDGENGILWNSVRELQSKTLELTKNSLLLNRLSKKAIKSAKKFSKERFCEEINRLILK
jgi:glycosyltransferase involved in cell wall biosynthesis